MVPVREGLGLANAFRPGGGNLSFWDADRITPPQVLADQRSVGLEPLLSGSKGGKSCRNFPPKPNRMIHLTQVHQFMDDDVLANK